MYHVIKILIIPLLLQNMKLQKN